MSLKRIRTFVRQFHPMNSAKYALMESIRKILDPHSYFSYSQGGEDKVIASLSSANGFYVDVGCNHPQAYSNTFALYKKGWSGITIDANDNLVQKHRCLRRRDISVCAVVSDHEREAIFTEFDDLLVSSLDNAHIAEWSEKRAIKEQRVVNTVSLNTILKEQQVANNFDLLSIDVEGHDFKVLISMNMNYYRPKLIVIEMHGFDLSNPSSSDIYKYLLTNNYRMVGYVVTNGYFLDNSSE